MSGFLDEDFLLSTTTARTLFYGTARHAPVVDVHTHIPAADVAHDRRFATLTDLWLGDDHYKWRAMRQAGFPEDLVTGSADPWDKFQAWAATVARLPANPLYLWTHLELRRVFGIDLVLSPDSAREIWDEADRQLPQWPARRLLAHFNVAVLATTDDPADDLGAHRLLAAHPARADGAATLVLPTWRPDPAHRLLGDPEAWNVWADRLETTSGVAVDDLGSLLEGLSVTRRRSAELGARSSDHGLVCVADQAPDPKLADEAVRQARQGRAPSTAGRQAVETEVLMLGARLDSDDDAVLQLHLGALRDVSPRLLAAVGRDAGGDAMTDAPQAAGLARLLGVLESAGCLRSVLYNLNPADNALFCSLAGAFSREGVPSPVQWGPPWWFNDHEDGMRRQLRDLAQMGQLAGFMGMVTDSRSLLSLTRHELFRRVLCDSLGSDAETGRLPADEAWLSSLVADVCTHNACRHFGLPPLR